MIPDRIPSVPTAGEIIEKSFKDINKVQDIYKPRFLDKLRTISIQKIAIMEGTSRRLMGRIYEGFPKIDDLDKFERDALFVIVNGREYERSLNNLRWARSKISELATNSIRGIKKAPNAGSVSRFRTSFYGRFSSIAEDLDDSLSILRDSRDKIKRIPQIDRSLKMIVIAGYPNVGKSSLIARITSLKPEIAEYPFTTKYINVGIMAFKTGRYEVLDVPGILQRKDHNLIERTAIAALNNIGDLVVCLVDPSEQCGFGLNEQRKLCESLGEVRGNLIVVENKADLIKTETGNPKISCLTGEGIDELKRIMVERINEGKDKGDSVVERA